MSQSASVIAIDGPSGTGKGTLCGILASWLGWHLLDSGALYRIVATGAMKHNIHWDDEKALAELALSLDVSFSAARPGEDVEVYYEGEEVSPKIRNEDCGRHASIVAAYPGVRQALFERQRNFRQPPGLIADGRDMGTVVFSDAELKIYLTANAEVRAQRRYKQLNQQGIGVNLAQLSADIAERDVRDSERKTSPLRPADDAVIVDTSGITIQQVVEQVTDMVRKTIDSAPDSPAVFH